MRQMRKWMIRLLQILIVVIIAILTWLNFLCHNTFVEFINKNQVYFALIPWLVGIGVAMTCYRDFVSQKQHEAVFGFYINMLVFLERLNVFLGKDYTAADVFKRLYKKDIYTSINCVVPPKEQIDAFALLSKEFLIFLSNSKDNVPPKSDKQEFKKWYKQQIILVTLLQKGVMLSETAYGDYDDGKLEEFYVDISMSVQYLKGEINNKIEKDAKEA
jgi:hypothetical protein